MKKSGRPAFLDKKESREGIPWKGIFLFIFRKIDLLQILTILALAGIGLAFIYGTGQQTGATSSVLWIKQLQYFALGGALWLFLSIIDYRYIGFLSVLAYPIAIGLLLYVLFFGTKYYGATRWISIAGYSIQPSELAKVAVVLTLSRVLSLKFTNINNPVLGVFHNQNKEEFGNCPYIDAFVNVQWKRACVFVKAVNVNMGWPNESADYFTAAGYIAPQRVIKLGITWPFYTLPGRGGTSTSSKGSAGPGSGMGPSGGSRPGMGSSSGPRTATNSAVRR